MLRYRCEVVWEAIVYDPSFLPGEERLAFFYLPCVGDCTFQCFQNLAPRRDIGADSGTQPQRQRERPLPSLFI